MNRWRVPGWLRSALLYAAWLGLSACPEGATQKLSASCAKTYDKCLLPNGVLGICDTVACAPDQAPPCLACRSQH